MKEAKKEFDGIAGDVGNVLCFRTTLAQEDSDGAGFLTSKQVSIRWNTMQIIAGYSSILETVHESLHDLFENLEERDTDPIAMMALKVFIEPICEMSAHLLKPQLTHQSPMNEGK